MRKGVLAGLLAAALFPVLLNARKPKVTVDPTANFALFKTYAWVPGTAAPNPAMNTLIQTSIDQELQNCGLQRVGTISAANLLVRYDVAGGVQTSYQPGDPLYATTGGMPLPTSTMWDQGGAMVSVTKGALTIRLMDTAKQHVVWSSSLEENLEEASSKRYVQVNRLIGEMFKDYPTRK